jgi:hypothetical protein
MHLNKRWAFFVLLPVFLIAVAISVVVRSWLPHFAQAQTRKALAELKRAHGEFSDVQVSVFPPQYRISQLKIYTASQKTKEPAFYADELLVTLRLKSLLAGRLKGTVEGRAVKVVLEQPPPGSQLRLPSIEELVPFSGEVERAGVSRGEVLYVWVYKKDQPSMWFHAIQATLENVRLRPEVGEGPMVLSARGKVQRSGTMTAHVTADPYATPLNFGGKVRISDFDLAEMNALIVADKGVKLSPGRFDMEMSFDCRHGRLQGWIEPRLSSTDVIPANDDVKSALQALMSKISLRISSPAEGTTASGRIFVDDDLRDAKLQLWPTIEKVVENGLLLGIQESLKHKTVPRRDVAEAKERPTDLNVNK